ncbi:MAG: hypothetical protein H6608_11060 [Flavobacteriales bacterium]|nr:hypothetical protein [Flavobacteriales bacterium]
MRSILIALFVSIGFQSFGQNWDWFPKDSLRVYLNPFDDQIYTGIDLRNHRNSGDTVIFDLSDHSRLDTLSPDRYFIHRNSDFGSEIIVVDNHVLVCFGGGSIDHDTFYFHQLAPINEELPCMENDWLKVTCHLSGSIEQEGDSVRIYQMTCQNKKTNSFKMFDIKISKKQGIFQIPILYNLIRHPDGFENLSTTNLRTYKEMSTSSFTRPISGRIVEFTRSLLISGYPTYAFWYERDSFSHFEQSNEIHNIDIRAITQHVEYSPYPHSVQDSFFHNDSIFRFNYTTDTTIYNPIPGKLLNDPNRSLRTSSGYYLCERFVLVNDVRGSYFFTRTGDTLLKQPTLGEIVDWHIEYMHGVGVINSSQTINSYHSTLNWHFLSIPGECELGERDWRFTSVPQPVINKLVVHPNPASTSVQLPDQFPPITAIKLIFPTGQILFCDHSSSGIELPSVSNGIYTLWVEAADGVYINKLMIQH